MSKSNKKSPDISVPLEVLLEMNKQLKIISYDVAIRNIEKLATTDERKAIWTLCSGKFTREELAKHSGAHLNTVTTFVDIALTYGLLEEEKAKGGHLRRVADYVPSAWKACIKTQKSKIESKNMGQIEEEKNEN